MPNQKEERKAAQKTQSECIRIFLIDIHDNSIFFSHAGCGDSQEKPH